MFAGFFDHRYASFAPLTPDFALLKRSLWALEKWNREHIDAMEAVGRAAWVKWLVDPDSAAPEKEILKPMTLNWESLNGWLEARFAKIVQGMMRLSESHGGGCFRGTLDLLDIHAWEKLSQVLVDQGRLDDALQALENADAVPSIRPPKTERKPSERIHPWLASNRLFQQMGKLVARGAGDQWDKVVIKHHLEHFDEWMEDSE